MLKHRHQQHFNHVTFCGCFFIKLLFEVFYSFLAEPIDVPELTEIAGFTIGSWNIGVKRKKLIFKCC
jgi:hypothetical protein